MNLLSGDQRITQEGSALQILWVHLDGADLAVGVGGVVIRAAVGAAAGGIAGKFIAAILQSAAAPGLGYGI